jgi:hypothetical protein
MASEFNKLSKDFLSTASKIEDALKDPLGGFLGLGEGVANLDSLINIFLKEVLFLLVMNLFLIYLLKI